MANRTPSSLLKKAGVTGDSQPMPFADLGGGSNNQAEQFREQLTALPDQQKTDLLIDLMERLQTGERPAQVRPESPPPGAGQPRPLLRPSRLPAQAHAASHAAPHHLCLPAAARGPLSRRAQPALLGRAPAFRGSARHMIERVLVVFGPSIRQ